MRPNILLFIESNTTGTGRKAFDIAKENGYNGILLTNSINQYHDFSGIEYKVCDTNDLDCLYQEVEKLGIHTVAGIMSTSEYYIEISAALANRVGLNANNPDIIRHYRDKSLLRTTLSANQEINQPLFMIVDGETGMEKLHELMDFPYIVKPAEDSGSNDVKLCYNRREIEEQVQAILSKEVNMRNQRMHPKVLIEEYIGGDEYSVEVLGTGKDLITIGITEKTTKGSPYFIEDRHIFPSRIPVELTALIERSVQLAIGELGHLNGAVHAEVKVEAGGCYIIEINPRLAGGMIPELIKQATGIDLLELHVRSFIESIDSMMYETAHYSGIQFVTTSSTGVLKAINGVEEIERFSGFHMASLDSKKGKRVRKPRNSSDRLGYVIVTSSSYEGLKEKLNSIEEVLSIELD